MNPEYVKTLIFFIGITLPLWTLARVMAYRQHKPDAKFDLIKREFAHALLYFYFIGLAALTLLPYSKYANDFPVSANVVPFVRGVTDLEDIVKTHTIHKMLPHVLENILGNVVLFIPVGILFPLCFRYFGSLKRVLLAAMLLSASVEILQWLARFVSIYRAADIDDIILNTGGAAIGFLFYHVFIVKRLHPAAISNGELTT